MRQLPSMVLWRLTSQIGFALLFGFTILLALPYTSLAIELPSTEEFNDALGTCATGLDFKVNADLIGSVKSIYSGERTSGAANFQTLTKFLDQFPEADRLQAYKLYTDCIAKILQAPSQPNPIDDNKVWLGTDMIGKWVVQYHGGYVGNPDIVSNDPEDNILHYDELDRLESLYDKLTSKGESAAIIRWVHGKSAEIFYHLIIYGYDSESAAAKDMARLKSESISIGGLPSVYMSEEGFRLINLELMCSSRRFKLSAGYAQVPRFICREKN